MPIQNLMIFGSLRHLLIVLTLLLPASLLTQAPKLAVAETIPHEYILKAGYISNFTKFIEWPREADSLIDPSRFILCLTGGDPFGEVLDQLAKKRRIKGKTLVIKRNVSAVRKCHILFVGRSRASRVEQIVKQVGKAPVLVIGDTPGFSRRGGGINLVIRNNKVRFEINRKAIERVGLKVSSELLDLAILVKGAR